MANEFPILYFIYMSIKNIQKRNKTKCVSKNELFEYIQPFLICQYISTKTFDSYFNFMHRINYFVEEKHIIYENNNYSINYDSIEYNTFKKTFNVYIKNITQMSQIILDINYCTYDIESEDDKPDDTQDDKQDDQSSDEQNDHSNDEPVNIQDDVQNDVQNDQPINEYAEDGLGYYICKSIDTSNHYLVNKKLNKCSCYAYYYSNMTPKKCKHLDYIKDNIMNTNELDVFNESCYCKENETDSICDHILYEFEIF